MDDELTQLELNEVDDVRAELGEDEAIAGQKKGDDGNGIIAILIG